MASDKALTVEVFARLALGFRGRDVFHLTIVGQVRAAVARCAASGARWVMADGCGRGQLRRRWPAASAHLAGQL